MLVNLPFPEDERLPASVVKQQGELLAKYLKVYHRHAHKKASAFLKAGRIQEKRYNELVEYFNFLEEEILLAGSATQRQLDERIDHADTFAWMCIHYIPDAITLDLILPVRHTKIASEQAS